MTDSVARRDRPTLTLASEPLTVEVDAERPVVPRYEHQPTGQVPGGAGAAGEPHLDGRGVPWEHGRTRVEPGAQQITYHTSLSDTGLSLTWRIALCDAEVHPGLQAWDEPRAQGTTLSWSKLPLLRCAAGSARYWRLITTRPGQEAPGKMWRARTAGRCAAPRPRTSRAR